MVYDDRIELIKQPLEHVEGLKIHGIWEIMTGGGGGKRGNEPSYLLGHCTKSYTSCWPIISDGLRISKSMGGRCGRGIYFSNDLSKCIQYASFTNLGQNISFSLIFFSQVYIGKIKQITGDNGSLTKSKEYDCIHAVGQVSPNVAIDIWHSDGTSSKIFIDAPTNQNIM